MGGASAIQLVCIDVEKFLPERDVHVDTIKRHVLKPFPDKTMSRLTPRLFFFQQVMSDCVIATLGLPLFYRGRIRKARYFQYTRQTVLIELIT